ncbi:MAG: efflux RND transporter permease subunit, partial [Anaerotignum sp.]
GESINMMALIACLVLVGIVVNNGIVLIDYITILRNRDGMELVEAVKAACPTRLRPILMTAMTTILGQFPIIFSNGTNSETLKSMGLVIAGGLTTSTFLTLVVVPLLYIYFDRFTTSKVGRKFNRRERLNPYEVELECS